MRVDVRALRVKGVSRHGSTQQLSVSGQENPRTRPYLEHCDKTVRK